MSISWGSWNGAMRVGIDVSWSGVSHGSNSVTATVKYYTQNSHSFDDSQSLDLSGSIGGSISYNNNDGTGSVYRGTRTYTHTYSNYGSSPGTRTFSANVNGAYDGSNPSKSVSTKIPARPIAAPNAWHSASAVRNSDTQATMSWSRNIPGDGSRPYADQQVQAQIYAGSTWGPWEFTSTVSASSTSRVWSGVNPNRVYNFRGRAHNSAGYSAWVTTGTVYTTPAAPSSAVAKLQSSGTAIAVSWTNNHYVSGTVTLTVERSTNGGAWTSVQTGLSYTTTSWTNTGLTAGNSYAYRVKAITSQGNLHSGYSTTSTLTIASAAVAPLAPTINLPTAAAVFTVGNTITVNWSHRDGGDGADQSKYNVRWTQADGTGGATIANGLTGTTSQLTFTAPTATVPANGIKIYVKTQGVATAGYSPESSVTVYPHAKPVVAITSPTDGQVLTGFPVTVTWTYSDDMAGAQSTYDIALLAADGVTLLEQSSADSAATSYTFGYALEDTASYMVRVQATSGLGITSDSVTHDFTMNFAPPAAVSIDADYWSESGSVSLLLTAAVAGAGESEVDKVTLQRSIDGGEWVTFAEDVELDSSASTTVVDPMPTTMGTNAYRALVVAVNTAKGITGTVDVVTDERDRCFVSDGPDSGFSNVLTLVWNPSFSVTTSRAKALHHFAGRQKPVEMAGSALTRTIAVSGVLWTRDTDNSTKAEFEAMGQTPGIVLWRDATGRRMFASIDSVQIDDSDPRHSGVSFTLTEVDYLG